MKKNTWMYAGGFLIVISIISILFHYPIHILDALTLETAPDFDVHISIWRIIFEPFIGTLLYLNRSFYYLDELNLLLVWILIIFIGVSAIKIYLERGKGKTKKFIIEQLINIPIVVGLWLTLLALVIFGAVYLPNNTIINNSEDNILVTTHSHSEFSHDGTNSQKDLWEWHKYNNFDAFYITDHRTHDKTLDFVNSQRNNEFPMEPLVLCGEEFGGSNHMSLLGLKTKFDSRGYEDARAIDSTRASGGAVIINHWFDGEKKSLEYFNSLDIDGFEIENPVGEVNYDRKVYKKIKGFCEENNLLMNGGLDFHGYGTVCSIWNAFKIENWHDLDPDSKEQAILDVIRNKDQSKLRVLLYKDRPDYTKESLFFRPVFTVFNYFRTLNFYQILSWAFWLLVLLVVKSKISKDVKLQQIFSTSNFMTLLGVFSSIFLLLFSLHYFLQISRVAGSTNDIYEEYGTILLLVGSIFLVYSGIVAYFRFFKSKK